MASINQPVALQVDPVKMGGHAHLVWYTKENGVSKLRPEPFDPSTGFILSKVKGLRAGFAQDRPLQQTAQSLGLLW